VCERDPGANQVLDFDAIPYVPDEKALNRRKRADAPGEALVEILGSLGGSLLGDRDTTPSTFSMRRRSFSSRSLRSVMS
jgi:hypothetical protein